MATVAKNTRSTTGTVASATPGPFSLGFRLFSDDAVKVYVNGIARTDWTLTSSYSNGYDDAATILFDVDLESGDEWIIEAAQVPWRQDDYVNGDPQLVLKINAEMARHASMLAELRRDSDRSLRTFGPIVPFTGTAGKAIIFDDSGVPVAGPDASEIENAQGYAVEAAAYAVEARAAANAAALYEGVWFDDLAEMLADESIYYDDAIAVDGSGLALTIGDEVLTLTGSTIDNETYIRTRKEGYSFKVAPPYAIDHDLETSHVPPIKLYTVPFSIYGLTFAANKGIYATGADTLALFDLTAAGRALLDDASASAQRTTLELGANIKGTASIYTTGDMNDFAGSGYVSVANTVSNAPGGIHSSGFLLDNGDQRFQMMFGRFVDSAYFRVKNSGAWRSWARLAAASEVIGIDQTWQNVAASRSVGTAYQNTTGKAIYWYADVSITSGSAEWQVSADGTTWVVATSFPSTGTTSGNSGRSILIPAGGYYKLVQAAGTVTIIRWTELR